MSKFEKLKQKQLKKDQLEKTEGGSWDTTPKCRHSFSNVCLPIWLIGTVHCKGPC